MKVRVKKEWCESKDHVMLYLEPNKIYTCFGIESRYGIISISLYLDDRQLFLKPLDLFEIIDPKFDFEVTFFYYSKDYFEIRPSFFSAQGKDFLEQFSDYDEGARSIFFEWAGKYL